MDSKFNLKWKEFQLNVTKSFRDLRKENNFYDVTLVSDDQKQVSAHKVVLSACSEYFSNILKQNPHSHPLLCLDGVSSTDLNNMLDYVYLGEVQIYQDDLDRFLEVAQKFKLEGLLQKQGQDDTEEPEGLEELEEFQTLEEYKKEKIADAQMSNIKPEVKSMQRNSQIEKVSFDETALSSPDELNDKIEQMFTRNSDNSFTCNTCDKTSRHRGHMKEHVEIHIEGLSYTCNTCGKTSRSATGLRLHKAKYH